ncbi:MAG: hypothetical protein LC124_13565 [Ignavibacteriales bacterium]|jgi:hypothetical protein|nr:MAG: hypothetical protein F9K42_04115 [Ignavibacterium sp.]MBW7842663.1 hypothetical protein [Ignavibacterium sp.]MCZ2269872.1 hypothetical protein [Ignavibacteriales bacterium]MDD5608986.1 hypothetical protein [Ignavibacterium sp.]MDX9711521.1 hypothetical protein [Ignavibacteriaceae bacterium]
MYLAEIEMYPDIINWLQNDLQQRFGKEAKKIQVLDTHDSDLSNFIMNLNYQRFFPEFATYQIRQDITGFIEYKEKVDLVFVECKNTTLTLINLSQLIGYSSIALPLYAILLSPKGMGTNLSKLLLTYNRKDVLEFKPNRRIQIIRWDFDKKDIDHLNSILL